MPHIHTDYDFTVTCFVVFKNRVLLVNHPRYDKWIPVGGHVELDEDPDEALLREIAEETGLSVTILQDSPKPEFEETKVLFRPAYVEVHEANAPHKHISLVYFALAENSKYTLSDEHTAMRWFGSEELDEPQYAVSRSVAYYARQAMQAAA